MTVLKFTIVLLVCHWNVLSQASDEAIENVNIKEVDHSLWQLFTEGKQEQTLVLFYLPQNCAGCDAALETLTLTAGQPEIPKDLTIGKSSDLVLAEKLGIETFPSLLFLRQSTYVIYDGAYDIENVLEWIQQAVRQSTHQLDDSSFEHLTQASSGATTGDWLVAFYKESCAVCKRLLPVIDSLGVRVQDKINVAKVNTEVSPVLVERFKITRCPEIIFFKHGKMYRYELPKIDVPSLRSFVDGFYKNIRAESVPIPKSKFDYLTEHLADLIKFYIF
ncbi:dnaJ homolog subfamily C member 10-like [Physella acuta]|uniref:dnaJ homolog subfamily C member 10-like n=1 Tax=Physella acuta TaxID=109671 RepID=UPI0027DBD96E|nr:dnaJ homolog subfamily C member 10-like [Physella acuta]